MPTTYDAMRLHPGIAHSKVLFGLLAVAVLYACGPSSEAVVRSDEGAEDDKAVEWAPPPTVVPREEEDEAEDGHHVGALETYRYWAGREPEPDIKVLNGEYWSSAHWTKEYTMYLELRLPRAKDFVIKIGSQRAEGWREPPQGAPDWFKPPSNYQVWEGESGSLYYVHPNKGHIYMYEVQF